MKKVYWLLDEVFAQTNPNNWNESVYLAIQLIDSIGNKELEHEIVNPVESFRKLVGKLLQTPNETTVSTIIDISGWIGYGLQPIFPQAELVTDLSLSRVLDVSTTDFRRAGYVMNMSQDEVLQRANKLDLSSVLIVDDTSVSGRTGELIMDAFGIEPRNATHLLLLANLGYFPTSGEEPHKLGALDRLEGLGSKIFYGDSMKTPEDDAEHIRDMFYHPFIERGFHAALRLHHYISTTEHYHDQLHQFLVEDTSVRDLFPEKIEETDTTQLSDNRTFMRDRKYVTLGSSIYTTNPLLWTFNEFWRKIDESSLGEKEAQILDTLKRFQSLSTNQESILEARKALAKETQDMLQRRTIEGSANSSERER
ncbi:hypothetical protein HYS94_04690 [Candidatus Daviesbacteria bacterium]|nr:hypothetical protein [Candidatus Daviesbacteria bacterium]